MPSIRINKKFNHELHFITMTVKAWYPVFDHYDGWNILANSLIHCQKNKDFKIFGYVFMLNHLHLIAQAERLSDVIGDFKKYTAKKILNNIGNSNYCLYKKFEINNSMEFWQKTNMPEILFSEAFFNQKLNYIHNNPVRKQYVCLPDHWAWSSAGYYYRGVQGGILVDDFGA